MYTDELMIQELRRIAKALEEISIVMQRTAAIPIQQMKEREDENMLINDKEAARRVGVSVAWFQQKRTTGGGPPYIKIGKSVRYRISDLNHWFALNKVENTAQWSVRKT